MNERDKRVEVISKLLAQATSVAGTPEADAFTDRALHLIAVTGIERADPSNAAAVRRDFPVQGDFLRQRITLLIAIATALHCSHAYWRFSPTTATVEIYGDPGHIDRVRLLYDPLLTRMFRQATESTWSPTSGLSHDDHRVSWMQGFILSIRERLRAAEATAAAEADRRDGADGHTQRHVTDAERADAERRRQLPKVRRSTYDPHLGREALVEGYRAVQGTDIRGRRKGGDSH